MADADAQPAPVSSLRSRFESLAQPGPPPSPTQSTKPRGVESIGLGRAPGIASAGRRVASASTVSTNDEVVVATPTARSSSAFVNGARGPPPPPPVAPRPHMFSAPPTVGHVPQTQNEDEDDNAASVSVASLRSRFNTHASSSTPTLAVPQPRALSPLPSASASSSSSQSTVMSSNGVPPPIPQRSPRIALTRPEHSTIPSPPPLSLSLQTDRPSRSPPPPLPIRHNTGGSSSGASASGGASDRDEGSSSGTSNCSSREQHQTNALLRPAPLPPPARVKPALPSRRQANGSTGSISPSEENAPPHGQLQQPPPLPNRRSGPSPTSEGPPPLPNRPPPSPSTPTSMVLPMLPMLPARPTTPTPATKSDILPPPTRTVAPTSGSSLRGAVASSSRPVSSTFARPPPPPRPSGTSGTNISTSLPPPVRSVGARTATPVLPRRTSSETSGSGDSSGDEDPDDLLLDMTTSPLSTTGSGSRIHSATSTTTGLPLGASQSRRQTLGETMPDSSTASRRPPVLHTHHGHLGAGVRVPTQYGGGLVAVSGRLAIIGVGPGIAIWDLDGAARRPASDEWASEYAHDMPASAAQTHALDCKDLALKDKDRITALAFRPALDGAEEEGARYVWLGTREGHLLELDAWAGRVVDVRTAIHSGAVVRIVRGSGSATGTGEAEMVTIDDAGKALRWACARGTNGAPMMRQSAKLVRLAERGTPTWAGVWGGWLWVASPAAGHGHNDGAGKKSGLGKLKDLATGSTPALGHGVATSSGGVVRVYDLSGGPTLPFVLKADACVGVGAVQSGTMLMTTPGVVYLGHDGGVVSVWTLASSSDVSPSTLSSTSSLISTSSSSDNLSSHMSSPPPMSRRPPPVLTQIVKLGGSDILTLDGIASRLWAGSRKGTLSAYDPTSTPWRTTNVWQATGVGADSVGADDTAIAVGKEGLPVLQLGLVSPSSHAPLQDGLPVFSVGRDGVLRFWDGLLSGDAILESLERREESFCGHRNVRAVVCSWNVGAAKAEGLMDNTHGGNIGVNRTFLEDLVKSAAQGQGGQGGPEIVVFGLQEVVDLDSRSVTAKTLLSSKNKSGAALAASITEAESHITPRYRAWQDAITRALARAFPGAPYAVVAVHQLVGLFSIAFVRRDQMSGDGLGLRDVAVGVVKRGLGGRWGNKGAVALRFVLDDSSICLVNCHLAAGQKHTAQRNADVAAILEDRAALPTTTGGGTADLLAEPHSPGAGVLAYVGGGDGSMILDHEIVLLHGDLNYRIDSRRDTIISYVKSNELDAMSSQDQLVKQLRTNPTFRLRTAGFVEASASSSTASSTSPYASATSPPFAPTYKYDRHSTQFDSSPEKARAPAWCDRILARGRGGNKAVRCEPGSYRRWEVDIGDHRPVSAVYALRVRRVDWQRREIEVQRAAGEVRVRDREMVDKARRWEAACGRA